MSTNSSTENRLTSRLGLQYPEARISGPDLERKSYSSYVAFQDPDGNAWIVQEVTQRAPGRELPK